MKKRRFAFLQRSTPLLPLITVCLVFFMAIANIMIVNVALPSIAKNIGASFSGLQWIAAGYNFTFASFLLSAGNCGDRFGAKTVLIGGLLLFVLASLGCGLVDTAVGLVIFRFLQGAAAAFLAPASLILIHGIYTNAKARARATGIWAGIGVLAGASSPLLSGILTSTVGWRAIFLCNIPLGLLALLLAIYCIPKKFRKGKHTGGFDLWGQIVGMCSIAALSFSLIEAGRLGLFSPLIVSGFILFMLGFALFLYIESRVSTPMLPLTFFKHPVFSIGIAVGMMLTMGGDGTMFVLPLYFQQIRAYSAFMAGLALLPFVGSALVGSYVSGRMTSAMGPRVPMMMGTALAAMGFFGMLIAGENSPAYGFFLLPLVAMGFGCGMTAPAVTIAILHTVPAKKTGMASGAFNASRQVCSLLGIAACGTIVHTAAHFASGMHLYLVIAGVLALSASVLAYVYVR